MLSNTETQLSTPRVKINQNLDLYVATLNGIQDQIRFADTKAGFIAALNTLPFGFIITSLDKFTATHGQSPKERIIHWILFAFLIPYTIATIVSIGLVVYSVMSRCSELSPMCKIFFGHIVEFYGKDHGKYVQEISQMTDSQWAEEIGTQIVEVSHIALAKHKLIRWAALSTLMAFVLWIVSMATISFVSLLYA
ncbi:MAG: Pycsar system effector family protein [Phycisphaerae bacterium]